MPVLWNHETNKSLLALTVCDFGVACSTKESARCLLKSLCGKHKDLDVNWKKKSHSITLYCEHNKIFFKISLPDCIGAAQRCFQHSILIKMQLLLYCDQGQGM